MSMINVITNNNFVIIRGTSISLDEKKNQISKFISELIGMHKLCQNFFNYRTSVNYFVTIQKHNLGIQEKHHLIRTQKKIKVDNHK